MKYAIMGALFTISVVLSSCTQKASPTEPSLPSSGDEVSATSLAFDEIEFNQIGCLQPAGRGTVDPAMSIFSLVFEINGQEREVRPGESLPVDAGDEVRLLEVTLCVGSYSGSPGGVCVDLAPLSSQGDKISSLHAGTHIAGLVSDMITLPGPEASWQIEEDWEGFFMVINHWPSEMTADMACGGGACEQDDNLTVLFD